MQDIDGWRFIGYYGVIYLFFALVTVIGYVLTHTFIAPIASLVFPIAENNSPGKLFLVMTGMFWGMVLFYTLVIQKKRLKF
jgi:hypothetical protein